MTIEIAKRQYKNPQFNLRMPQLLKDQIEEVVVETGRSMNAEIVRRLADSFEPSVKEDEFPTPEQVRKLLEESKVRIQKNARRYALETIMEYVNDGQANAILDFSEQLPDIMTQEEKVPYIQPVIEELVGLGYDIVKSKGHGWYEIKF
ncbi:MAG: hypothetical protein COA78_38455 [Blastopirellula sp.]|nr:MAG: hypothetical protein COA78_38455 [Blastopirellula sp.]